MSLPPPVAVSPLIKFARWAALIAGIRYGYNRRGELEIVEMERRAEEERTRESRERRIKEERAQIEKRDLLEIENAVYGRRPQKTVATSNKPIEEGNLEQVKKTSKTEKKEHEKNIIVEVIDYLASVDDIEKEDFGPV